MKRVLHISDLHFGRIHTPAIESLKRFLQSQSAKFDLVIMTGDWTQRARKSQYQEAADFIKEIGIPVLTIPGNHDLPLYNFIARILGPLKNYRNYISTLTSDTFVDDELAVVGFRTATFFRTVEGFLRRKDLKHAQSVFQKSGDNTFKIIASHHPIAGPEDQIHIRPKSRIKDVIDLKPHIVLSGHSHLHWIELIDSPEGKHKVLHISAGSAVSNRLRGEVNSFHTLEIENKKVKIETYFLEPSGFIMLEKYAAKVIQF